MFTSNFLVKNCVWGKNDRKKFPLWLLDIPAISHRLVQHKGNSKLDKGDFELVRGRIPAVQQCPREV